MTKLLSVNWEITKQCNLACTYCRVNAGLPQKNELTTKQVLSVIDELKRNGFGHLKFTGGEPLIRKDFWKIVRYAHKNSFKISLISNGLLIDEKVLDLLAKYVFVVGISIDSIEKETNQILGRQNYELVMKNIQKLVDKGLRVKILSTITRVNRKQISDLLLTAKKLGVEELKINDIVLNGRAADNKLNLALERPLAESSDELAGDVKKILKEKVEFSKLFKCECNQDNLYIDYRGDLYPCVEMCYDSKDYCLGNVAKDKLGKLLKINKKFYGQIKNGDHCAYSYMSSPRFSACLNRGGCPKNLRVYMDNAKK